MSSTSSNEPHRMDALAITESLGIKTFRRNSRNTWLPEEDKVLSEMLTKLYRVPLNEIDSETVNWDLIAGTLCKDGSRKPKDFKKRWMTSLDPNLRKGKWTPEEDEKLKQAYEKYGASWQKVASSIKTRTMDQCAKRYTEVLDPKTKDRLIPWSEEEELLLIKQVKIHGTKWRTVASNFKNRPALTCRNRWRKIVMNVFKGKADPKIRKEVEAITKKDSSLGNIGLSPESDNSDVKQLKSETLWKYTLSDENGGGDDDMDLPHKKLFDEHGGIISNEQLAHYLVSYAKSNELNITIHQHIHHHYASQLNSYSGNNQQYQQQREYLSPGMEFSLGTQNSLNNTNGNPPGSMTMLNKPNSLYLDPEVQLNRFQHFNYLPPLTEVPRLTSSNSPSLSTSRLSLDSNSSRKKNELPKLLGNNYKSNSSRDDSPTPSMTPLTQAVQIAAEEEKKHRLPQEQSDTSNKRNKPPSDKSDDEDVEEGMDFWEQMRYLTDLTAQNQYNPSNNSNNSTGNSTPGVGSSSNAFGSNGNQKPVSQHHPLHYFTGNVTPQPQPQPQSQSQSQSQPQSDDLLRSIASSHPPEQPSISNTSTSKTTAQQIKSENGDYNESDDSIKPYDFFNRVYKRGSSASNNPTAYNNINYDNNDNDNDNNSYVYESLMSSFGMPFNPS